MVNVMKTELTDGRWTRPIGMSRSKQKGWKRVAAIAALLCAAASVKVMANPAVRRPVAQFIYFYQQTEQMDVWERVVYSVVMTKTASPETTGPSS